MAQQDIASLNIFAELEKWRALPPEKQSEQMFLQQLVSVNCLAMMSENLKTLTNSTAAVTLAVSCTRRYTTSEDRGSPACGFSVRAAGLLRFGSSPSLAASWRWCKL